MTKRLAILIGDFAGQDAELSSVLDEWGQSRILNSVAFVDSGVKDLTSTVRFSTSDGMSTLGLFDLLTAQIWDSVSIIAVRQARLDLLEEARLEAELRVLSAIQTAFKAHAQLVLRTATVSIIEEEGFKAKAFNPQWDAHLLHEPIVRIDGAVASQPMVDGHRAPLVALLATALSGGFAWQLAPLMDELRDSALGNYKPLRISRAYLRVVSAGRLTDEVLAGAFPASGPWSVPPDVPNAQAVPPSTVIPDSLIDALCKTNRFGYSRVAQAKADRGTKVGMWEGLKYFCQEFVDALKSIPKGLILEVKKEVEKWAQNATFGPGSSILLSFDPDNPDLDLDDLTDAVQSLQLGNALDSIGEARPWENLQKVALGLMDGGKFPSDIEPPSRGVSRLVFTDPSSIGPAPATENFQITDFERDLLGLSDHKTEVFPMEVFAIRALDRRLARLKAGIEVPAELLNENLQAVTNIDDDETDDVIEEEVVEDSESVPQPTVDNEVPSQVSEKKKFKIRRKRKDSSSEQNSAAPTANEVTAQAESESPKEAPASSALKKGLTPPPSPKKGKDNKKNSKPGANRHRPGSDGFDPADYTPLTPFYQGSKDATRAVYEAENRAYAAAVNSYQATKGYWKNRKGCDHCGTPFDHGILYLHEPTQELVHVGHQCARKSLPSADAADLVATRFAALEERWIAWRNLQSNSLLYRLAVRIVDGAASAEEDLKRAIEFLNKKPQATKIETAARDKFKKWTRRGLLTFLIIVAASIASIVFTPLPILLLAGIMAVSGSGLVVRLLTLARDLVRARHRLRMLEDQFDYVFKAGTHAANELVRLGLTYEQFEDWQLIIREVTHIPFGRQVAFSADRVGIAEVRRPPGFVLGQARPNDEQKMRLYLSARSQTIHAGWLTEIMDILKSEWAGEYQNSRMTSTGDNILPEADNAPSGSVIGKRPLSDEDVYYPRTDFRVQLLGGRLQTKLVERKSLQIAAELKGMPIDSILGNVEVTGLGRALSGQSVRAFLAGLSMPPIEPTPFTPDIFSERYPEFRVSNPEITLPSYGAMAGTLGNINVEPGSDFTAAVWRIELSGPIAPAEAFKACQEASLQRNDSQEVTSDSSQEEGIA